MKYVPREPEEGINVSKTHPLVEAGALVTGVGLMFLAAILVLVFLLEFVLFFVSPELEAKLFARFSPADLVVADSEHRRLDEARDLLRRLDSHLPDTGYEFRLEVERNDELNAMAFPGGLIVVTSALLDAVASENELAFVLGHELGHYENRDQLRRLGRGALFGIVFSALGIGEGGADIGLTLAQLAELQFSQEQESDADKVGLALVYKEYGHVADAARFFERIREQETVARRLLSYASTHPAPGTRIRDLDDLALEKGWPREGPTVSLSLIE